ncbi:MAG: hypothetical protein M1153_00790, partial [Patescibacteria group bacterium]|nr:hypothetical protein [Patescibacteria group bacterium]
MPEKKKSKKPAAAVKKISAKNKKGVKNKGLEEASEEAVAAKPLKKRSAGALKSFVNIKVVGVGGAGGNALTRMADDFVRGVDLIAINTDLQDLEACQARRKLHIGEMITKGRGAGMNPELGRQSAEENREEVSELLKDAD